MSPQTLTAQDFDQELLILFDAYVHGGISRRGFWTVRKNSPQPA